MAAPDNSTMYMPRVATMRARGDARWSWRITPRWASAPMAAHTARATGQATTAGSPCCSFNSQWT